jgi:hypothetical protein
MASGPSADFIVGGEFFLAWRVANSRVLDTRHTLVGQLNSLGASKGVSVRIRIHVAASFETIAKATPGKGGDGQMGLGRGGDQDLAFLGGRRDFGTGKVQGGVVNLLCIGSATKEVTEQHGHAAGQLRMPTD